MIRYRLLLLLSSAATIIPASHARVEGRIRHHRRPGDCFVDAHRPPSSASCPSSASSSSFARFPHASTRTSPRTLPVRRRDASSPPIPLVASSASSSSHSIISPSDSWGNVAALSFAASLAQLLGRTTAIGKLLGAPVTAMALSFALSSVDWLPRASTTTSWTFVPLLPPGGSIASSFLQSTSLALATPLLLLGTNVRSGSMRGCESLLGSFVLASSGTIFGSMFAFALPYVRRGLESTLPYARDGPIIASALLAKNIGGGINYVAVCACLGASPESVAAGLCVDNVMALIYFPLVSLLASRYGDCDDDDDDNDDDDDDDDESISGGRKDGMDRDDGDGIDVGASDDASPMEALSHAMTLAAVLTALGRYLNAQLRRIPSLIWRGGGGTITGGGPRLDLSLPITTLLAVSFSTFYPPDLFLSPTTTRSSRGRGRGRGRRGRGDDGSDIARAGQTFGTSLLYLFFATAGAPGWKLKDSIQTSFPSIASFLILLYGVHGCVLLGTRWLISHVIASSSMGVKDSTDSDSCNDRRKDFWKKVAAPQRLLVASSAAIGGPATAAALAKSFRWESLLTPSLIVGNVGYAVATFIGLLFYSVYR
jgi:hypothetical protein